MIYIAACFRYITVQYVNKVIKMTVQKRVTIFNTSSLIMYFTI